MELTKLTPPPSPISRLGQFMNWTKARRKPDGLEHETEDTNGAKTEAERQNINQAWTDSDTMFYLISNQCGTIL